MRTFKVAFRHAPAAKERLEITASYELAPSVTSDFDSLQYPAFLQGMAELELHDGLAAELEFKKRVDRPYLCGTCSLRVAALVGLARACAIQGANSEARATYQPFLTLWQGADSDVPILKEAKAEYAKLQ